MCTVYVYCVRFSFVLMAVYIRNLTNKSISPPQFTETDIFTKNFVQVTYDIAQQK